jgi:NADPH-dependent curcumin reductase CurA
VPISREIHLAARPQGWPTADNFRLVEVELPEPGPGQVLVRNLVMSVDPYMRGRMNDVKSYVPPFQLDQPLDGGAVGEVVTSGSPDLKPGDVVLHPYGWRDLVVADAGKFRVVDTAIAPASAYLGVLGMPALTAYAGLLDVAGLKAGDTVFVSGAAGAVGSMAGQIARLKGAARVVGSAGTDAKVAYLVDELGFDAAFNYRNAPVRTQLNQAAPDGIDVYFDNVGGDHLEAAIGALRLHGRAALCGAIAQYNNDSPMPGPANLAMAIGKRLTLRGFLVSDHYGLMPQFVSEAAGWLEQGQFRCDETVMDGLAQAPEAFISLLRGGNTGKMLVRLGEQPA